MDIQAILLIYYWYALVLFQISYYQYLDTHNWLNNVHPDQTDILIKDFFVYHFPVLFRHLTRAQLFKANDVIR